MPNGYINAFGGPTFGQGTCTWATSNASGSNPASQIRKMISLFNNGTIMIVQLKLVLELDVLKNNFVNNTY